MINCTSLAFSFKVFAKIKANAIIMSGVLEQIPNLHDAGTRGEGAIHHGGTRDFIYAPFVAHKNLNTRR
jgi:hypothetical protein